VAIVEGGAAAGAAGERRQRRLLLDAGDRSPRVRTLSRLNFSVVISMALPESELLSQMGALLRSWAPRQEHRAPAVVRCWSRTGICRGGAVK
jgi:hypothetical protein